MKQRIESLISGWRVRKVNYEIRKVHLPLYVKKIEDYQKENEIFISTKTSDADKKGNVKLLFQIGGVAWKVVTKATEEMKRWNHSLKQVQMKLQDKEWNTWEQAVKTKKLTVSTLEQEHSVTIKSATKTKTIYIAGFSEDQVKAAKEFIRSILDVTWVTENVVVPQGTEGMILANSFQRRCASLLRRIPPGNKLWH